MTDQTEDVAFRWKPNPAIEEAREWIEKNKLPEDAGPIDTHFFREYDEPVVMICKAVKQLEEKENMLSAVLELCGFSREDSSKAVITLIEDLKFYSQNHWPYLDDSSLTRSTVVVEFTNGVYDVPLIGRILGPAMRLGRKLAFCQTDKKSSTFWHYLVVLLTDFAPVLFHHYPNQLKFYPEGTNVVCGGEIVPNGGQKKSTTPMIIFETADIFSAVRGVIESVWKFNGQTYWTPTHVFVQESQYELFVRLLKVDAVNYVQMLGIGVKEPSGTDSKQDTKEGFPVLQPSDRPHFKFFLGWDPKILDSDAEGVVVLPFRTVDEGISSANALKNSFCASIWTDKLKFDSKIAPLLKVNTIWVNCHGVLDHQTSFGCVSRFVPLNGPDLFESLLATTMPKHNFEVPNKKHSEVVPLKEFTRTLDEALKSTKSLFSAKFHERVNLLQPLEQRICLLDPTVRCVWPSEFSYKVTDSGVEIISQLLPSKPAIVNMLSDAPTAVVSLLVLVHYILMRGSGVIVRMPSTSFLETLQQHLPLGQLCSGGFLFFVIDEGLTLDKDVRAAVVSEEPSGEKVSIIDVLGTNYHILPYFSHLLSTRKNVLVF